jgi:hypothetical protein
MKNEIRKGVRKGVYKVLTKLNSRIIIKSHDIGTQNNRLGLGI